jgi:fructose-1,6-bisphosphatase/inositol monophosphatase family enzyme
MDGFGCLPGEQHEIREMPCPYLNLGSEAAIAAMAAAHAGPQIRAGYNTQTHGKAKGVGDFVTATDRAAEKAVIECLQRGTPELPIISEESSCTTELPSGRVWIVDPLDGTSAFIFKSDPAHPAVMVALVENGAPIVSVVYLPLVDRWFCAEKGKGAWMIEGNSESYISSRLTPEEGPQALQGSHVVMNHYGDAAHETAFFTEASRKLRSAHGAGLVTIEPPNSAVSCRMMDPRSKVVAVIHDNDPANPKQQVWDIAPVLLIVQEAGGLVTDPFGNPYRLGTNAPIVVSRNPAVYRLLFDLIGQR